MGDRMRAMRRPGECYSEVDPQARRTGGGAEVGMRLPPKMTPAQIAEAQRMAREWKRLGAPGRSALSARRTSAPREGSFQPRSPQTLVLKLGVALAQPVQRRLDPRNGLIEAASSLWWDCGSYVRGHSTPMEGAYGNQEGHPGRFAGGA